MSQSLYMVPSTKWLDEGQYDDEKTLQEPVHHPGFGKKGVSHRQLEAAIYPVKEEKKPNFFTRLFMKFFFFKRRADP